MITSSQVQFIGVMSNVQDSLEDAKKYKADHSISFEIGKDHDQKVADLFSATHLKPVIDQKGLIRYRGRIDNQYQPELPKRATEHDLRNAPMHCWMEGSLQRPRQLRRGA